jgi:nitroimidazol reductase NimA-like FMN-containing flavoprotein (pyridoxamine 5'-phosphate oxidase superfamily)
MSSNLYGQFTGIPMSDKDIDEMLESKGFGILSLCRDGEPYSIPISFGFDGERIFFAFLETSPDSMKMEYIEEEATARLLVTDIRGRFDWQSIAITGPVRSVSSDEETWDHFMDTLDDNGWFMRGFERADDIEAIHGWELQIEDLKGLERKEEVYD